MTVQYSYIVDDVAECVGQTPMVRLKITGNTTGVDLLAKAEFMNPGGSLKDRVAKKILDDARRENRFPNDATLVVPTTGNLGISLALLAHRRGHRVIALVPEKTSQDRIHLLKALGVEILRTPNDAHPDAAESHIGLARRVVKEIPNAVVIDEFVDPANPAAYKELADEIYQQCNGQLDVLVVGVESGGSITGLSKFLKSRIPNLKVVAVEPRNSKNWHVEDLGNTYISKVFDKSVVDAWLKVDDRDAYATARRLGAQDGLLCGPSSGATVSAAMRYALDQNMGAGARMVVILNDTARNYQSTLLANDWLVQNGLADEGMMDELRRQGVDKYRGASIEDLQLSAAVSVNQAAPVSFALDIMLTNSFSQVPVVNDTRGFVGFLSLGNVQSRLESGEAILEDPVKKWMYSFQRGSGGMTTDGKSNFKIITPNTPLVELDEFFEQNPAAFVTDEHRKFCLGVVTKYDLVSFLSRRPSSSLNNLQPRIPKPEPTVDRVSQPATPFSLQNVIRPNILSLAPYRCARDDYSTGILLDANENSYGPSLPPVETSHQGHSFINATSDFRSDIALNRYPDPHQIEVKEKLASFRNVPSPDHFFLGVGSDEVIDLLMRICCVPAKDKILITPPTYGMYSVCAQINNIPVVKVNLNVDDGKFQLRVDEVKKALDANPEVKLVFLCSPGNPTGSRLDDCDIVSLLDYPSYRGLVVVDEAYVDFVSCGDKDASVASWVVRYPNLVVMQTLSKSFGLAGIRLGVGISNPTLIRYLNSAKAPYNISTPTSLLALQALSPSGLSVMRSHVSSLLDQRSRLMEKIQELPRMGRILGTSDANFVLVQVLDRDRKSGGKPSNEAATDIYKTLAEKRGVVVRFRGNEPGCFGCLRITVGTEEQNEYLLQELKRASC